MATATVGGGAANGGGGVATVVPPVAPAVAVGSVAAAPAVAGVPPPAAANGVGVGVVPTAAAEEALSSIQNYERSLWDAIDNLGRHIKALEDRYLRDFSVANVLAGWETLLGESRADKKRGADRLFSRSCSLWAEQEELNASRAAARASDRAGQGRPGSKKPQGGGGGAQRGGLSHKRKSGVGAGTKAAVVGRKRPRSELGSAAFADEEEEVEEEEEDGAGDGGAGGGEGGGEGDDVLGEEGEEEGGGGDGDDDGDDYAPTAAQSRGRKDVKRRRVSTGMGGSRAGGGAFADDDGGE